MNLTRQFQSVTRILVATIAIAGLALMGGGAAGSAQAAGLGNCTVIGGSFPRSGCWEDVWAGGSE